MSTPTNDIAKNFLAPRAYAYLNGIFLPSWEISVEQTAYSTTDTATVKTLCYDADMDYGAYSQQNDKPIPFTVSIGAPSDPSSYTSTAFDQLLYGFLDELDTDYDDDYIEFRVRGVLSLLADSRTTQRVNQNIDVADALRQLIANVGLTPQVNSGQPAGVSVGRILQDDFVMMGRNLRILEYMQTLANGVGWTMRCQGVNVIIGPPPNRASVPVLTKIHNNGGDTSLHVKHSALHAHDIKVRVVSYIAKQKSRVASGQTQDPANTTNPTASPTLQAPTAKKPKDAKIGGRQQGASAGALQFSRSEEYVFHIPGLTAEECDRRAALIQAEISRHEFVAEMKFAPSAKELRMLVQNSPEFLVKLEGCSQSSHNQLYHPRKVTWDYTVEAGLIVSLLMVNHDVPTNTGGE